MEDATEFPFSHLYLDEIKINYYTFPLFLAQSPLEAWGHFRHLHSKVDEENRNIAFKSPLIQSRLKALGRSLDALIKDLKREQVPNHSLSLPFLSNNYSALELLLKRVTSGLEGSDLMHCVEKEDTNLKTIKAPAPPPPPPRKGILSHSKPFHHQCHFAFPLQHLFHPCTTRNASL
jgi:hypothetical protein